MNIHDLYPRRRELVAWMKSGVIVDVETDGEIIARIEPAPEIVEKKPSKSRPVPKKRRAPKAR
jgi:hypothetical protein